MDRMPHATTQAPHSRGMHASPAALAHGAQRAHGAPPRVPSPTPPTSSDTFAAAPEYRPCSPEGASRGASPAPSAWTEPQRRGGEPRSLTPPPLPVAVVLPVQPGWQSFVGVDDFDVGPDDDGPTASTGAAAHAPNEEFAEDAGQTTASAAPDATSSAASEQRDVEAWEGGGRDPFGDVATGSAASLRGRADAQGTGSSASGRSSPAAPSPESTASAPDWADTGVTHSSATADAIEDDGFADFVGAASTDSTDSGGGLDDGWVAGPTVGQREADTDSTGSTANQPRGDVGGTGSTASRSTGDAPRAASPASLAAGEVAATGSTASHATQDVDATGSTASPSLNDAPRTGSPANLSAGEVAATGSTPSHAAHDVDTAGSTASPPTNDVSTTGSTASSRRAAWAGGASWTASTASAQTLRASHAGGTDAEVGVAEDDGTPARLRGSQVLASGFRSVTSNLARLAVDTVDSLARGDAPGLDRSSDPTPSAASRGAEAGPHAAEKTRGAGAPPGHGPAQLLRRG